MAPLAGKFEDAQENDPADYLPAKAESVKAIEELEEFPSGDISEAITVFNRGGGLTEADKAGDRRDPGGDQLRSPRRGGRDRAADPTPRIRAQRF